MISCTVNPGACWANTWICRSSGESRRLPRLGDQVQHQRPARRGGLQGGGQLRHQDVRDDAGEPRPRPEHHQVGGHDRVHRLPGGRRIARQQPDPAHLAGVVAIATWPRITRLIRGSDSSPATSASICNAIGHIGSTRPLTPRMRPNSSSAATGSASTSFEPGEHQIADRMTRQCAVAAEPMLDDRRPQPPLRTVGCQRRQRHSQIAWRHAHRVRCAAAPKNRRHRRP